MNIKTDECIVKFGLKVRELRMVKKISQEEFASIAGMHRTYIGGIERGERNVTLTTIHKIATALNVQPYQLLKNDNE